jgi:putative transcriptional regulator
VASAVAAGLPIGVLLPCLRRRQAVAALMTPMNNHVRALHTENSWPQGELAERLHVSRQTVNAIETGRYDPSLPLAFRIAKRFCKSIEAIFDPEA